MPWFDPVQLAFRTLVGVTHWSNYLYHNPRFLRGRILWQFPAQALFPAISGHGTGTGAIGPTPHTEAAWTRALDGTYPQNVDSYAYQLFALPPQFIGNGSGNVNVTVRIYSLARAVTGSVRWQARLKAVADGEDFDGVTTWDGTGACTCPVATTLGQLDVAEFSVSVAGLAANDLVALEVARLGTHADDNLAADAQLLYIQGEAG